MEKFSRVLTVRIEKMGTGLVVGQYVRAWFAKPIDIQDAQILYLHGKLYYFIMLFGYSTFLFDFEIRQKTQV